MIKAKFRENVLEALATFHRLPGTPLVRVDDLDAVAGPAQRDGHVGQRILPRGRLLVLEHLLRTRLADIDDGLAIEMMVTDLGRTLASKWAGTITGPAWEMSADGAGVRLRSAHDRPPSASRLGGPSR